MGTGVVRAWRALGALVARCGCACSVLVVHFRQAERDMYKGLTIEKAPRCVVLTDLQLKLQLQIVRDVCYEKKDGTQC